MIKILEQIKNNGIKKTYDEILQNNLRTTNILNVVFILFVFPFLFIFSKSISALLLTSLPIFLHLISLVFIRLGKHKIGRFIFSITTATSVYIAASFIYIDDGTDGMAAKFLILGSLVLPFVVFSLKEKNYIIIVVILDFFYLISFNYMNSLLNLSDITQNFDTHLLRAFAVITAFVMFTFTFFEYKINQVRITEELAQAYIDLKTKNDELLTIEEELRQSNEAILSANKNLQQQKELILSQKEKLEKLRTAVEQSDNTIVITDNDGKIEYVNKKFEELTGYKKDEIFGKTLRILKSCYHSPQFYKDLWDTITQGKVWTGIFRNKKKNGELYWEETKITPVRDDTGKIISYVAVKDDVTERIRMDTELKEAYEVIKEKNKNINQNIQYANRIQNAILPKETILKENFEDFFVFYKPADIVSGDFYFFTEYQDYIFIVVGDCTGHGVAGGFISMLGHSFLYEVIHLKKIINAADILSEIRKMVIAAFNQSNEFGVTKDGMDMSICRIEKQKLNMQFAAANQLALLVKNDEKIILKGDRMPISIYPVMRPFGMHKLKLDKGDKIYMFTDGFQDQFSGETNEKYYRKNFLNLLYSMRNKPMSEQKEYLEKELKNWLGNNSQIDDILVLGITF